MWYKLKKLWYEKRCIAMVYEKESYNTWHPPVKVQTYFVIKNKDSYRFVKYRKIITHETYYELEKVLKAKGYKDIALYYT